MSVSVCMLKDAKINEVFTPLKRAHVIKCIQSLNLILKSIRGRKSNPLILY